jgi:hypothetical protein
VTRQQEILLADGHHELYLRDARHVAAHADLLRPY